MDDIKPMIGLEDGYRINETFSDDFEGSELNGEKWYPFCPEWEGRKLGRFVPENVCVKDGTLQLTARIQDEIPLKCKAAGYSNLTTACVRGGTHPPKENFHFKDGFHTATFLREKEHLRRYLDGRLTFDHPNDYYHNPMDLNIDCEPLFAWCGEVDKADLPAVYTLEYVRVWQK